MTAYYTAYYTNSEPELTSNKHTRFICFKKLLGTRVPTDSKSTSWPVSVRRCCALKYQCQPQCKWEIKCYHQTFLGEYFIVLPLATHDVAKNGHYPGHMLYPSHFAKRFGVSVKNEVKTFKLFPGCWVFFLGVEGILSSLPARHWWSGSSSYKNECTRASELPAERDVFRELHFVARR